MEFPFDVNYVLPYEVTIFNGDYRILNPRQPADAGEKLSSIIDTIGDASYRAQGLSGAVTNARKFRVSDHRLYIIKRANDNNNLGSVVGILKVGFKHLYVYDSNGRVHERTPLCVLDFYVHESKQRLGYGKRLFDTMLEFEKCAPYELAIDRPSHKCLAFLNKHYHLSAPIYQTNNFVVYPAFFNQSPVNMNSKPSMSKQSEELTSWLLPSQRRPFSEQHDFGSNPRIRTVLNENEIFANRPQMTFTPRDTRQVVSSYTTTYGQHYNQINPNGMSHSASYTPRRYSQVINENKPFPHLQRYNTNPIIPLNSHISSVNDSGRILERIPTTFKSEPLTSIYTFPSLIKPNFDWHQQPSTTDSNSSAWRLFGIHRLLN